MNFVSPLHTTTIRACCEECYNHGPQRGHFKCFKPGIPSGWKAYLGPYYEYEGWWLDIEEVSAFPTYEVIRLPNDRVTFTLLGGTCLQVSTASHTHRRRLVLTASRGNAPTEALLVSLMRARQAGFLTRVDYTALRAHVFREWQRRVANDLFVKSPSLDCCPTFR